MPVSLAGRGGDGGHPRLAALVAAGVALLAVAAVAEVGPWALGVTAFRVGVVGYLLVAFGLAGYAALGLAARLPDQ